MGGTARNSDPDAWYLASNRTDLRRGGQRGNRGRGMARFPRQRGARMWPCDPYGRAI
jgi:hypothetical protein